ncbi:hypothetical protein ABMA27_010973 [Loxostege sticticalis]|uniref:Androgen-dependent TFPI-regulating protein n=1 Tax=Loxostege sticticalis TaxID=481309 RepID=A0ABR3H380_LOXSC
MDKGIYYRLAGNGCMFFTLATCILMAHSAMQKQLPSHPELELNNSLSFRYATIWNMFLQLFYSALAFTCDLPAVLNKEEKISPAVRKFRFRIFHELVFPNCWGIAMFWPIYFFDRELIFPIATEIIIPTWQNIVVHGVIFAYVAWEMAFLPEVPRREEIRITPVLVIQIAYIISLLFTKYIHPGAWVYDILGYLEGSVMFYLVFFSPLTLCVLGFYAQWAVRRHLFNFANTKLKL